MQLKHNSTLIFIFFEKKKKKGKSFLRASWTISNANWNRASRERNVDIVFRLRQTHPIMQSRSTCYTLTCSAFDSPETWTILRLGNNALPHLLLPPLFKHCCLPFKIYSMLHQKVSIDMSILNLNRLFVCVAVSRS